MERQEGRRDFFVRDLLRLKKTPAVRGSEISIIEQASWNSNDGLAADEMLLILDSELLAPYSIFPAAGSPLREAAFRFPGFL